MTKANNYTAADGFPIKILHNRELIDSIVTFKEILPVHVQFIPTNRCNLSCDFCSCSNEDRGVEMSLPRVNEMVPMLRSLGTQSVTLTGGGDPMMHKNINYIIDAFLRESISVGMVTNGTLLHLLEPNEITWCRISNGDSREFTNLYRKRLERAISKNPDIDWAFSHVVSTEPNIDEMVRIIEFANSNDFTHVRIVPDITQADKIDMNFVEAELTLNKEVGLSKVIFQPRNEPKKGSDCYICYLKPIISADGRIYTCCGAQYAFNDNDRAMPDELCLGTIEGLKSIISESSEPFDGSMCKKCYYTSYNTLLGSMMADLEHVEFV